MRKNDVKVLSEIEHVLHRPGMYVGDTTLGTHSKWVMENDSIVKKRVKIVPAFLKLFDEVISNSIDEGFRTNFKFANEIKVNLEENGKITVTDNGRGIPVVESHDDVGITQAEQAFTNLRAGANFDDDGHVSIGTHGLGATLVNILSKKFIAHTDDGKKHFRLQCARNLSEYDTEITKSKGEQGTSVSYFADFDRLGMKTVDADHQGLIEKRVNDLAVCFPKIRFKYNGRVVQSGTFKQYLKKLGEVYEILETPKFKVAVLPAETNENISFINGIDTFGGGVHCDIVSNDIANALKDAIKKKHRLDIRPSDIKNHMLFVIITNSVGDPKFDSQTKERLTNNANDIKPIFDGVTEEKFIGRIMRNDELVEPIIEALLLKKQLADARALKKANKGMKKAKVASHISASSKDPEDKILFITEGQSAISNLINVRKTAIHGGFPLRGKPRNVRELKPTEIMKNKELSELMSIIGLELGEPADDLNYGKIGILADADYDGFSIAALLVNFFSNWKQLFDEERVLLIKSPIVVATKAKQIKRFYDLKDFVAESLDSSWKIQYNKGLGSLSVDEYDLMINDPVTEVLAFDSEANNSLETAFGKNPLPRKKWLMV